MTDTGETMGLREAVTARAQSLMERGFSCAPGSTIQTLLAADTQLAAQQARIVELEGTVARYEALGGWTILREREARRFMGDPAQSVGGAALRKDPQQ